MGCACGGSCCDHGFAWRVGNPRADSGALQLPRDDDAADPAVAFALGAQGHQLTQAQMVPLEKYAGSMDLARRHGGDVSTEASFARARVADFRTFHGAFVGPIRGW